MAILEISCHDGGSDDNMKLMLFEGSVWFDKLFK